MKTIRFHIYRAVILAAIALPGCSSARAQDGDHRSQRDGAAAKLPHWGIPIDPAGDCAIEAQGGTLTVTIPGGSVHTLSNFEPVKRAPRVLQEITGDFTAEVKVTGEFDPGSAAAPGVRERGRNSFNGAGLLVWDTENNFIRLERNIWVTSAGKSFGYAPLFEYWRDNRIAVGSGGKPDSSGNSECTWLRISRRGNQFRCASSVNGTEWSEKAPITATFPQTVHVGVAAINSSQKPFRVEFSEFKLSQR